MTRAKVQWPKVEKDTFQKVHDKLQKLYGPQTRAIRGPSRHSVLDSVVSTVLSQNTNDRNSGRAFRSLKEAFPTWEECRNAPAEDIKESIKSGGLANIKAARIKGILEQVHQNYGKTDLEFLRDKSTEDVKEILQSYKGLGPKTISCVLMFNLQREDFPVDTHVHRVSRRLGWVPDKASREATYNFLNVEIPEHLRYSLHILMIKHGRQICKSQKPRCGDCPLVKQCPYGQEELGIKEEESEVEEVVVKKRSWTSRRRKTSVGDIEDLFTTKSLSMCGVQKSPFQMCQ